jgi:glycerol uptake facilitator-like aquaporin
MIEDLLELLRKFSPKFLLSILFQFLSFLVAAYIFVPYYLYYNDNHFVNSLSQNNTILVFPPPDLIQSIILWISILVISMGFLGYLQPLEDRTDIIPIILGLFLMGLLLVYAPLSILNPIIAIVSLILYIPSGVLGYIIGTKIKEWLDWQI